MNGQTNDSVRAYNYATEYAGQYARILQRLAAGDLPAVEHCTAGKDRTGVFSAILLTALGVPRDVVIQDYLLSNQYLLAPDTATVRTIMTSKPETLEGAFDLIEKKYRSFEDYRRDALHFSDSNLAAL